MHLETKEIGIEISQSYYLMLWSLVLKSKIQSSWLAAPYKTSPEQLAIPRGTPTQGNLAGHTAPPVLSCADWVGSAPLSSQPAPETTGRSERIRDACPHLSHSWPWTLSGRSRWSKACRGAAVAAALLETRKQQRQEPGCRRRGLGRTTLPYHTMGLTKSQLGACDGGHLHNLQSQRCFS